MAKLAALVVTRTRRAAALMKPPCPKSLEMWSGEELRSRRGTKLRKIAHEIHLE